MKFNSVPSSDRPHRCSHFPSRAPFCVVAVLLVVGCLASCANNPRTPQEIEAGRRNNVLYGPIYRERDRLNALKSAGKISDSEYISMSMRLNAEERAIERQGAMMQANMFMNDMDQVNAALSRGRSGW